MSRLRRQEERWAWLFISPWILGFLLFDAGPILASFGVSLTKWNAMTPARWAGLGNYSQALVDPLFWKSLRVTLVYSLFSIPLSLALGLSLALLLNQKVRALALWRTIYYLPSVVSGVAVAMLWSGLFNPGHGLINLVLTRFGVGHPPLWLNSEGGALPALLLMGLWGAGGGMILYLAALQGVPTELYEAASLDGAGKVQSFLRVTLPMISPVLFFSLVMGLIGDFQIFTQPMIMTHGGPNNATLFYSLYLYRQAFRYYHMGYASALAWVLFALILGLTLLLLRGSKRWVHDEGDRP